MMNSPIAFDYSRKLNEWWTAKTFIRVAFSVMCAAVSLSLIESMDSPPTKILLHSNRGQELIQVVNEKRQGKALAIKLARGDVGMGKEKQQRDR